MASEEDRAYTAITGILGRARIKAVLNTVAIISANTDDLLASMELTLTKIPRYLINHYPPRDPTYDQPRYAI